MRQLHMSSETGAQINPLVDVLTDAITELGQSRFQQTLLNTAYRLLPAAACLRDRICFLCEPMIYLSALLTKGMAEVCASILRGLSLKSMAFQMNLSISTFRNRAFDRVDTHFRNELFVLMMTSTRRVAAC